MNISIPITQLTEKPKKAKEINSSAFWNGLGGIRTPDTVVRSHVLWSTELQALALVDSFTENLSYHI